MAQALPSLPGLRAVDVMTRDPVTMESTGTVQDAADLMWAADVRHIPVLERGTLVGMISERDLRSYMLPRPERMFRADEEGRRAPSADAVAEERARLAVSVRAVIPSGQAHLKPGSVFLYGDRVICTQNPFVPRGSTLWVCSQRHRFRTILPR